MVSQPHVNLFPLFLKTLLVSLIIMTRHDVLTLCRPFSFVFQDPITFDLVFHVNNVKNLTYE
jgi:hypothetical protein